MKWQNKINKKEMRHLNQHSATGKGSMCGLVRNLEAQHKIGIHCFECRHIARKLGLPVQPLS